jgi:hypothetical protein
VLRSVSKTDLHFNRWDICYDFEAAEECIAS